MWEAFKLYISKMWSIIKPSVVVLMTKVGKMALAIAVEVVTDLSKTDLSSSEKREAAFDAVKEKLEAAGKSLGNSVINLIIEIAVQKFKSNG